MQALLRHVFPSPTSLSAVSLSRHYCSIFYCHKLSTERRRRRRLEVEPGFPIQRRSIGTRIYEQLSQKGLLQSCFPDTADMNQLLSHKQTLYAGFDPTAPSLHVGNLLILIVIFHLLRQGHRVIILVGDATAQIGDPSGRITERPDLPADIARQNAQSIELDIRRIYDNFRHLFAANSRIANENLVMVRNSSWYNTMNTIEFIARYGRQMRMGEMLRKDNVRERLETGNGGMNFGEFSYQLFQAYDWLHLYRQYRCRFQLGGADQMINIHHGHDLIRKVADDGASYGLLVPLITDDAGRKLGKSDGSGKTTYLSESMTSCFNFYQYWMRLWDVDIGRLFRMFSFRPERDIEALIQQQLERPKPWRLQRLLADEMTTLVHGKVGLETAHRITKAFFEKDLDLLGALSPQEITEVFDGAEEFQMEFVPGRTTVLDLAMKTNAFKSNYWAVKQIVDGGFYINYVRVQNPELVLTEQFILANHITIVRCGKRNYHLVKWL